MKEGSDPRLRVWLPPHKSLSFVRRGKRRQRSYYGSDSCSWMFVDSVHPSTLITACLEVLVVVFKSRAGTGHHAAAPARTCALP